MFSRRIEAQRAEYRAWIRVALLTKSFLFGNKSLGRGRLMFKKSSKGTNLPVVHL